MRANASHAICPRRPLPLGPVVRSDTVPVKFQPLPPRAVLNHHFRVAPVRTLGLDSGLIWLKPTSTSCRPGDVAGCLSAHSKQADRQDWKLCFDYTKYYVSRIIYALHHGVDPAERTVDHIDRNPLNNSVENLQLVDRVVQNRNRRLFKNNTSGVRGVSWSATRNGWIAQIGQHGKMTCLGVFACKVEAAVAYNSALHSLCPERYEDLKHSLVKVECGCTTCNSCLLVQ